MVDAHAFLPVFEDPAETDTFRLRVECYGPDLLGGLRAVYGDGAEALYERVLGIMGAGFASRPRELRLLDEARLLHQDWLQRPGMVGYVAYADRFADTLAGVGEHLDHLTRLGVTYLHLMPLLKPREGENDGGYAVADLRAVRPDLGTMDDLEALAASLRQRGISMVLDLVLNHVAAEHEWALRARAGDPKYRAYFHVFGDREQPDAHERTLPEVFPDFAPGNFTWVEELGGWVWTTFHAYQWDLDWSNPDVFCEFLDIILHLANKGVEVLRLDAIAFLWKRLGTNCQNQPEVHHLTRALRSAVRVVAPAVAFKAEAIVAPTDLATYLGTGENHGKVSDMAYHNSLMVQLWSALASRDTRLTEVALSRIPAKPTTATWGTYVRCHDDIGWAIGDDDARRALLDGHAHRVFLSDFYAGYFPGSFARGLVFQHNPATNDRRISGTCASLAGLEAALEAGDRFAVDESVRRILLLHTAIMGFGGIPLLYMGDELALLNDHSFAENPEHARDNRWVHRPRMDWELAALATEPGDGGAPTHADAARRVFAGLRHVAEVRAVTPHLHARVESRVIPSPDARLLILKRDHPLGAMVQVYNVSEDRIELSCGILRAHVGVVADERLSGFEYSLAPPTLTVEPYAVLWLTAR
ncbi:MAG: alpha-amylase family protein [Actinomycetota bacterium]